MPRDLILNTFTTSINLRNIFWSVRTNRDSSRWLLKIEKTSVWIERWNLRLQKSDFEVVYIPGIKDTLDRLYSLENIGYEDTELNDNISLTDLTKGEEECLQVVICDYKMYSLKLYNWVRLTKTSCNHRHQQTYPKRKQKDDLISWEIFLREKDRDPVCQWQCEQHAKNFPKADSNRITITKDSNLPGLLSKIARKPSATPMFSSLRQKIYWRFMANDVFESVKKFSIFWERTCFLTTSPLPIYS